VVVARRAAQALSEQCRADVVRHVVEELLPRHRRDGHRRVLPRPRAQEADRYHHLRVVRVKLVARKLFSDEAVVRLVGVE
jgi:hypothetical protein